MRLITYLPISRIGDIEEYQYDNVRLLNPEEFIVVIDNTNNLRGLEDVVYEAIKEAASVRVRPVNVGNSGESLLIALSMAEKGDVIVNSDVILHREFPTLLEVVKEMSGDNMQLIGIAEVGSKPTPRDVRIKAKVGNNDTVSVGNNEYPINATRIVYNKRGFNPVFFGPKQAIIINHAPNKSIIDALTYTLSSVPRQIRQCIADETILGLYAIMNKQQLTPWFPMAYNTSTSDNASTCNKHISDYAHYLLFKNIYISGLPKLIATRYLLSAITHL
jgi:hypothetical protein